MASRTWAEAGHSFVRHHLYIPSYLSQKATNCGSRQASVLATASALTVSLQDLIFGSVLTFPLNHTEQTPSILATAW